MKEKILQAIRYYIEYQTKGNLSENMIFSSEINLHNFFHDTNDLYSKFYENQLEEFKYLTRKAFKQDKNKTIEAKIIHLLGKRLPSNLLEEEWKEIEKSAGNFQKDIVKQLYKEIKVEQENQTFYLLAPLYKTNIEKLGIVWNPLYLFQYQFMNHDRFGLKEITCNQSFLETILSILLQIDKTEVGILYQTEMENFLKELGKIDKEKPLEDLVKELEFQIHIQFSLPENWHQQFLNMQTKYTFDNKIKFSFHDHDDNQKSGKIKDDLITLYKIIQENHSYYQEPQLLNRFLEEDIKTPPVALNQDIYNTPYYGSYPSNYLVDKTQYRITKAIENQSLISVIGPPGTGKSSLLREMIANEIVNRAIELEQIFDIPWEKCSAERKSKKVSYYKIPYALQNQIHSIVVTSKNNDAIANVSDKINQENSYFEESSRYFKETKTDDITMNPNFKGMICAKLGNATHVSDFGTFLESYFLPTISKQTYDETEKIRNDFKQLLQSIKMQHKNIEIYFPIYQKYQKDINFEKLPTELDHINLEIQKIQFHLNEINSELSNLNFDIENLNVEKEDVLCSREELEQTELNLTIKGNLLKKEEYDSPIKRFLKQTIWKKKAMIEKANREIDLQNNTLLFHQNHKMLEKMKNEEADISKHIIEKEKEYKNLSNIKQDIWKNLNSLQEKKQFLKDTINYNQTFEITIQKGMDSIDFMLNKVLFKLKMDLFSLSLKLQEQYILKHKHEFLENLNLFWNHERNYLCTCFYKSNFIYESDEIEGIKALWDTFFLSFPVVTTTLDSFTKNVFSLIPNYIDLLLMDESGQATSDYTITSLYRCKRAVIVGDIYQIEPIYKNVSNREYNHYYQNEFEKHIAIHNRSIQHMANENTEVKDNNELIELINHHRCEENIIQFSNQYVYNHKLKIHVKNDLEKPFGTNLLLFDIRSLKTCNENINYDEIDAIIKIIKSLKTQTNDKEIDKKIAIITPFKHQVAALKHRISKVYSDKIEVGTTHTFQGKEKEYIIYSTVIDEYCKKELFHFVGKKPNLLNVAVSRAINQFILVGNVNMMQLANNYLTKLYQTIKTYGKVYSVFEEENQMFLEDNVKDLLDILVSNEKIEETEPFGAYLKANNLLVLDNPKQHHEVLIKALELAKKSVFICSPWLSKNVIDETFISLLTTRIQEKVQIKIRFGYMNQKYTLDHPKEVAHKEQVFHNEESLETLIKTLKPILKENFIYKNDQSTHAKILLVDEKYLFIGSHNWLSNAGKMKNGRSEASAISTSKEKIAYIQKFFS